MPMNEADKVREFGNLEYEVEMSPFLEPISKAGFDPNVVKVMQNVGSHYNPNTDEIIIGNFTGTANLSEQAHEFRHRGLKKLSSEFFLNIPTLKREMPPEDFKRLLDFFETERKQNFRKRGAAGGVGAPGTEEYKFDRQEMIAEFFEEPYDYNLPAQYYAATGEDPASAKFQRVMNINPETGEFYTDEERAAYAARTGTVIKKMLQRDTVQDQMDRLETVGQEEFRTFADADPETRIGDEIFKQAMLVQDFARKQNDDAKNYSEGGAVMNGIGTLNETARNMFRGPRGIGVYQQYAMGGEAFGPPPMRGPDPQGIARYAPGGPVESIRPQARPESVPEFSAPLTSLRPQPRPESYEEMAEIQTYLNNLPEEKFFEINSTLDERDGFEKPIIKFKDGAKMFLTDVENMINGNKSASEPVVGKSTAEEVLKFLQEKNPTSQEFLNYFSSARLAGGGEVEEPLSEYRKALIASESSGRSDVVNKEGYMGLTQAGDDALIDFKKEKGLSFTDEEYLRDADLQMQFQDWYEQTTINFVINNGLDAYIGKVVKGVPITMSSLLGMAHLGGNNGMKDFLESGGRDDPNDGNTSLSDYGVKFANMRVYGDSHGGNINRATPEDIAMSMPVEQKGSLGYFRPQERPEGLGFSAPLTSLRPQARPALEPEMRPKSRPLALPEGQSMIEKYGLPGDMPESGIMSAIR